jgi:hypothetical protein
MYLRSLGCDTCKEVLAGLNSDVFYSSLVLRKTDFAKEVHKKTSLKENKDLNASLIRLLCADICKFCDLCSLVQA